jgi:hypothetical protein
MTAPRCLTCSKISPLGGRRRGPQSWFSNSARLSKRWHRARGRDRPKSPGRNPPNSLSHLIPLGGRASRANRGNHVAVHKLNVSKNIEEWFVPGRPSAADDLGCLRRSATSLRTQPELRIAFASSQEFKLLPPPAIASYLAEGAMEIGTKKWHESLSDVGWEVLALAGMLMQTSVLAIILGIVYLLQHRG